MSLIENLNPIEKATVDRKRLFKKLTEHVNGGGGYDTITPPANQKISDILTNCNYKHNDFIAAYT